MLLHLGSLITFRPSTDDVISMSERHKCSYFHPLSVVKAQERKKRTMRQNSVTQWYVLLKKSWQQWGNFIDYKNNWRGEDWKRTPCHMHVISLSWRNRIISRCSPLPGGYLMMNISKWMNLRITDSRDHNYWYIKAL